MYSWFLKRPCTFSSASLYWLLFSVGYRVWGVPLFHCRPGPLACLNHRAKEAIEWSLGIRSSYLSGEFPLVSFSAVGGPLGLDSSSLLPLWDFGSVVTWECSAAEIFPKPNDKKWQSCSPASILQICKLKYSVCHLTHHCGDFQQCSATLGLLCKEAQQLCLF